MPVVSILKDGRLIASGSATVVVPLTGGDQPVVISFPELKKVEYVLSYKFDTDPVTDPGTPVNEKVDGNVVGVTLVGVASGTTLTVRAEVIGW